jgi:GTP cyclohydrolase I
MHPNKPELNDVAVLPPEENLGLALKQVGLENVQMQVLRDGHRWPARGEAAVSLIDRKSRGIHMSRLFKIITQFSEREFSWERMSSALDQMLESHAKLSDAGHFQVATEWPVLRAALLSGEHGWRTYPVTFKISRSKGIELRSLTVRVLYSSTCPCSASLSRQAMQEQFKEDFAGETPSADQVIRWLGQTSAGAPHSQRSEATVEAVFEPGHSDDSPLALIDVIEKALGTPVQAAVKREDEQEFARLNAENLMFCEDAARKIKAALLRRDDLADYAIEVRHFESLHAHDVVARVGKND